MEDSASHTDDGASQYSDDEGSYHSDGNGSYSDEQSQHCGSAGASIRSDDDNGRNRRRRGRDQLANDNASYDSQQENSQEGSYDSRSQAASSQQSEAHDGQSDYTGGDDGSRSYYSDERSGSQRDDDYSRGSQSRGSRSYYSGDDDERSYRSGSDQGSRSYYSDEERSRSYPGSERSRSPDSSYASQSQSTYEQSHDMLSLIQEEDSRAEQSIISGPSVIAEAWEREQRNEAAVQEASEDYCKSKKIFVSQQSQSLHESQPQKFDGDDTDHGDDHHDDDDSRYNDHGDDHHDDDSRSQHSQSSFNSQSNGSHSQQSAGSDALSLERSRTAPFDAGFGQIGEVHQNKNQRNGGDDDFGFGNDAFSDDAFADNVSPFGDGGADFRNSEFAPSESAFDTGFNGNNESSFGANFSNGEDAKVLGPGGQADAGSSSSDAKVESDDCSGNVWGDRAFPESSQNESSVILSSKTPGRISADKFVQNSVRPPSSRQVNEHPTESASSARVVATSRVQALTMAFNQSDPRQRAAMLLAKAGDAFDTNDTAVDSSASEHSQRSNISSRSGSDSLVADNQNNQFVGEDSHHSGQSHSGMSANAAACNGGRDFVDAEGGESAAELEELEDSLSISNLEDSYPGPSTTRNRQPDSNRSTENDSTEDGSLQSRGSIANSDSNDNNQLMEQNSDSLSGIHTNGKNQFPTVKDDHSLACGSRGPRSHTEGSETSFKSLQESCSTSARSHSPSSAGSAADLSRASGNGSRGSESFSRLERSNSLSADRSDASYSQESNQRSRDSGSISHSEVTRSSSPAQSDASFSQKSEDRSRVSESYSQSERTRSVSPDASDSQRSGDRSGVSESFSQSERTRSSSPDGTNATDSKRSGDRSLSDRSSSPSGSYSHRSEDRSVTNNSQTLSNHSDYHSESSSMDEYPPSHSPSKTYGMHASNAQNSTGTNGSTMNDSTPSFANESSVELGDSFKDESTSEQSHTDHGQVYVGATVLNDSSAGSSAADSFAAESFANESITDGFDDSPARNPASGSPRSHLKPSPAVDIENGQVNEEATRVFENHEQQDGSLSADAENSYSSGDEEDSFFEKTLIAQEPDMLPRITEHSVAEKSNFDESEFGHSAHASVGELSLRSIFSSSSRRSRVRRGAAGSVVSGASGIHSVDTLDVSIVSGMSNYSEQVEEKGRGLAQKKGYSREQMRKLRHDRQKGDSGESATGEEASRGTSVGKGYNAKRSRSKRAKVKVKSDSLLTLVANVSEAMDDIDKEVLDEEEKKEDDASSAKELLLGFEALVGIILQFSDELELMSTFARKRDAASIDALQSLINFAPVIDDVFVELNPILQQCLVDDVDEEMNDLLYGMNLTLDLLCEMTHLVGERQEWNIRANTSYVTLLELLSRDALEVACIFDDIDTPEYELTEQIEDAWSNTGHEEEFKTLQVTADLTIFRQICYDVMLSVDHWCPDINTLMDICGIDDTMLENETVEDHPDDRMFETPETALQVLEKINGDVLPRTVTMSRVMRRIMPTDFITDQLQRDHIQMLKSTVRDQLGLPVSNLVAISSAPEVLNEPESPGIAGVGKTTLAAMVANHPDTRKFFNDGIAWIHIGQKEVTYTRYIQCLRELMAQIDIGDDEEPLFPELLHVPCESQARRRRREEGFMMYAREIMVDFLQFRNVLIILDDVSFEPDLDWFDFDPAALQTDETDDEFSCVILVTTRCRNLLPAADTIEVDMLSKRDSIKLLVQESGELASSLSASAQTESVVKECAYHPLAVKSVGRWLNLKHATAGVSDTNSEMHQDVINSIEMILKSANQEDADMMYEILNMSLSPAINGEPTNIIKFCFAAFVLVFCDKNQISDFALADATPIVPLTIAETLFEALLQTEEQTLLQEGSLFYAQKKEAAVLIPEALSALGVLKVIITFTAAESTEEDSQPDEIEEKYLQVMHAVQEEYGEYLYQEETTLADLTKDAQERWNRAFGLAYLANAPDWAMETPDAGVDYAFEMIPAHLILGGLYTEAADLLTNTAYVKGRLFALGRENGTRRQIKDCEALFDRLLEKRLTGKKKLDPKSTMKKAYEVLGSLINMDEDEYIAQEGSTEALEVARAHSEIAFSLAEKRCWDAAIKNWEMSQELLVQSLGMVELVAGIQLNIGVLYGEMNEFERALNAMKQCLKIRGAIHGEEHILYAQTIQKIGDIFLKMSDYHEAMESYNWALDTLHVEPSHHRIDIGDILENMGSIYYSKGEIDEALQCYQDALRSKEVDLGEDHPELATTFQFIGNCLSDQGKTEEAIAHYEEAIRLKQMDAERGGEREADILTMQGVLHNLNGRQHEGLECYEKALQVLVTKAPHKKEKVASLLHLIGCVYLMSGEQKKSMKLFEESLQARRKVLGFVHLDVASTLFNMAFLFQSRNRLDKALKCLEEALKIRQLRLPDSEKVAITHEKIGTLARSIGKTKKAEIAFNEALRIRKLIHGSDHEAVATVLQELGDLMDDLGEYDEAMKHYVEALDIRQTQLGPDDLAVAETLYSMGFSLQNNGATGRALQCFEECLSIRKFQLGEDAILVGDVLNMMGYLHAQRGELDDSLTLLWDALRVRKIQDDHMKVSETLKNIGNVHREKQEHELAIECYEECLRIRRAAVGDNHEKVADAFIAIGNVQSDLDMVDDAMRSYEEALRIRTMIHGEQDESVAAILQYMGTLEFRAEQLDRALQLLNEFIRIREEIGTANDGDHVNVLFMIGNIHKLKGEDFEAQRCWTEAYKVFKELGLADPEVAAVMEQLVGGSDSHRESTADSFRKDSNDGGILGKLTQKVKSTQRAKKSKGQQL
ncbi:hypothetical protein MPSEU_000289000 [Mayamaea pseudoterrestris]|nr:hypothetical protein MPSEU_000289000 [Mayamaea pseudoterrestris]